MLFLVSDDGLMLGMFMVISGILRDWETTPGSTDTRRSLIRFFFLFPTRLLTHRDGGFSSSVLVGAPVVSWEGRPFGLVFGSGSGVPGSGWDWVDGLTGALGIYRVEGRAFVPVPSDLW